METVVQLRYWGKDILKDRESEKKCADIWLNIEVLEEGFSLNEAKNKYMECIHTYSEILSKK